MFINFSTSGTPFGKPWPRAARLRLAARGGAVADPPEEGTKEAEESEGAERPRGEGEGEEEEGGEGRGDPDEPKDIQKTTKMAPKLKKKQPKSKK